MQAIKLKFSVEGVASVLGRLPANRRWLVWWPLAMAILFFCGRYLHGAVGSLERDLLHLRGAAVWTDSLAGEARQLKLAVAQKPATDPLSARKAAEAALQKLQVPPGDVKLDTQQAGQVDVAIASVSFNTWLRWVELVFNEGGLVLGSARVVQISPGVVKVDARLTYR